MILLYRLESLIFIHLETFWDHYANFGSKNTTSACCNRRIIIDDNSAIFL